MKSLNLQLMSLLATGCLAVVSTPASGDAPSCTTINVAATKVWLEKEDHKKDDDKEDKEDKDDQRASSAKDDDKNDKKDKEPKPPHPEEDVSCDKDERSKDVFFVDADLDFKNVGTFVVPDVIPVIEGKSRKGDSVVLEMGVHDCDGFTGVVTCSYRRIKPAGKHHPHDEWSRYRFAGCNKAGITPGKTVTGNALSLHVAAGGKNCPDNRTTVSFNLNACGVGDILP